MSLLNLIVGAVQGANPWSAVESKIESLASSEVKDIETAALAGWAAAESAFNTAVPTLAGQFISVVTGLATGGEAGATTALTGAAAADIPTAIAAAKSALAAGTAAFNAAQVS